MSSEPNGAGTPVAAATPATAISPNTSIEHRFSKGPPEEFGLALSGGGIRATLFHYGAIRRINDLGYLRRLDRVAGVSDGAIAAGFLARSWDKLQWDDQGRATNLDKELVPLVMRLAGMYIDIPLIAFGALPFVSVRLTVHRQRP